MGEKRRARATQPAGSGVEEWIGIETTLGANEGEAIALLREKVGSRAAQWIFDAYIDKKPSPPAFLAWWLTQPPEVIRYVGDLREYIVAQRRIRALAATGRHEEALKVAVRWMINPDSLEDVEVVRRARSRRGEKWAKAIVQAGIDFARALQADGSPVTARAVFGAFKQYTLKDKLDVFVGEPVYKVWHENDVLYEERAIPSGALKPVKFITFRKKPYYFPAIKQAL